MKPYATPGDFRSDLDEVITSKAYRRLSNKSQVMVKPTKDHFRSRLIHTIEVDHLLISICTLSQRRLWLTILVTRPSPMQVSGRFS